MKLMMSDWKVDLVNDCVNEFTVIFKGPSDSELSIRITCLFCKRLLCVRAGLACNGGFPQRHSTTPMPSSSTWPVHICTLHSVRSALI